MLVAQSSLRQQQERQMFALRSTGQLTVPTVPPVRVNLVYKASTFRIQKLNGATWARGERDTGHADSATIGKGRERGKRAKGGWVVDQQPGIHLVICQTSRTSKHFYNPCTNTTTTTATRASLIRLRFAGATEERARGEVGRAGRGWGIWKKCCYNNQNALNCKTYNFTVIFSLVSCNFFSTHA